jgi:5'-methylthioadenosine phosphorylase
MKIGLISGYDIKNIIDESEKITIETEYGNVQINVKEIDNNSVFFINRHGTNKNIPPHKINYRANIKALSSINLKNIISIGTVGSLNQNITPGSFLIPNDFIDFTKLRLNTYFDKKRVHVDMTNPLCPNIRKILIDNSKKIKDNKIHNNGVYLSTEGPRLETAAEISFFSKFADIVGMTLGQEIILSRELNICYAAICIICNMGTGLQKKLEIKEMEKILNQNKSKISKIVISTIKDIDNKKNCECQKYEKI